MRVLLLLLILLVMPLASAQNETQNGTVDPDVAAQQNTTDGGDDAAQDKPAPRPLSRLQLMAINGVVILALVGAFVYFARR